MPDFDGREAHLAWCRQRALEYLDLGDPIQAITSLMSDLGKHEQTVPTLPMTRRSVNIAVYGTLNETRAFIEECTADG
jgi:hypothetical protein